MCHSEKSLIGNRFLPVNDVDPFGVVRGIAHHHIPDIGNWVFLWFNRSFCLAQRSLDSLKVLTMLVAQKPFAGTLYPTTVRKHAVPFAGFALGLYLVKVGGSDDSNLHITPLITKFPGVDGVDVHKERVELLDGQGLWLQTQQGEHPA